ncbi:PEP-CTERM sorting domain-containing protein [Massilia sp. LXY-6]|uniref:PEP-CTERM sorting domain-containing protein n=1 Tax=Massilia sp. LXY-6 TaxID=3379823 RepID=UPI003EDF5492
MHIHRVLRSSTLAIVTAFSLGAVAAPASATTILFVGNSFTYGDPAGGAPLVKDYRPATVTDLNGSHIGGVPSLFKAFTLQAGLNYDVSLETVPGVGVDYHYNNKLGIIAKPFDKVLLQSYSTLDGAHPGDPTTLIKYSGLLAQAFHDQNPNVDVLLTATWSRADQTYKPSGAWYGQPIDRMALDVRAGYDKADLASDLIDGVIPVGQAWNRAIASGLADANPYDGKVTGINLWAPDSYHGSVYGYYLEALTIFGEVTGLDPRSLGTGEYVARDLGISPEIAGSLQQLAAAQLAAEVPEPGMAWMFAGMGALMLLARRRNS